MHRFTFRMPACALASSILLAAPLALAQQGSDEANAAPGANDAHPSAPAASALPGVVLERNVFVPVDAAGKPTSDQFIVVERRSLAKGDAGSGNSSGDGAANSDVPTRFILVPQQSADDSGDDGSSGATQ